MASKESMMVIKVCIGSACHLKGSYDVIKGIEKYLDDHQINHVDLKSSFCLGKCSEAVSVEIDETHIVSVSPITVNEMMQTIMKE